MWRCKGQHNRDGLWPLAEHRQSPDMNQRRAIILASILSCLLCERSASESSGGRRTVSSVLTYVQEGCCHWLLGVIIWLELHRGSWARVCGEISAVTQLWDSLEKICWKQCAVWVHVCVCSPYMCVALCTGWCLCLCAGSDVCVQLPSYVSLRLCKSMFVFSRQTF